MEPWIDGLWGPLERVLASDHGAPVTVSATTDAERLTPGGSQSETGREGDEKMDGRETDGSLSDSEALKRNTRNTSGVGSHATSREVDVGVETTAGEEISGGKGKPRTVADFEEPATINAIAADNLQKAVTELVLSKGVTTSGVSEKDIDRNESGNSSTVTRVTSNSSQQAQDSSRLMDNTAPVLTESGTSNAPRVEGRAAPTESVLENLEASQLQAVANLILEPQNPRTNSIPKNGNTLVKAVTCSDTLSTSKLDFGMEPGLDKPPLTENQACEEGGMEWVRTETQLRTPSIDLVGEQLTPPTTPPPFIRVELTEVCDEWYM